MRPHWLGIRLRNTSGCCPGCWTGGQFRWQRYKKTWRRAAHIPRRVLVTLTASPRRDWPFIGRYIILSNFIFFFNEEHTGKQAGRLQVNPSSICCSAVSFCFSRQDAGAERTGRISNSAWSVHGWNMIPPVCPECLREVSRSSQQNSLKVRLPGEPSQGVWTDGTEQTAALGVKGDTLFGIIE